MPFWGLRLVVVRVCGRETDSPWHRTAPAQQEKDAAESCPSAPAARGGGGGGVPCAP